jgi:DNA invertase Pin-like site-specific DNA recombinase
MKIAGYIRISTEDRTREDTSLEMQKERLKEFALAKA